MGWARRSRFSISVVLLAALVGGAERVPDAKTEYRDLAAALRQAREQKAWQIYLADAARMQQLLNAAPATWLNFARGEVALGHIDKALAAVGNFVAMEQSAELLLNSPEFAALRQNPGFATIKDRMAANRAPVSNGTEVFDLDEPGFVAEDISYDPQTRRFFISSIQKHKIIAVDRNGKAADFAYAPQPWPMMALKVDAKRRLLWTTEVALDGFASIPKADWGKSVVLCYDLDHGKLLQRFDGPAGAALADMLLLPDGDPLLSDGGGGGVYRLSTARKTLERVDAGSFISPQTAALDPDRNHVFVPDYLRGIGILNLGTKQVVWLPMETKYALNGTDGLYFHDGRLILTQNGTSPERVIELKLDSSHSHIVAAHEIERATPTLGDPTHGVIVDRAFYYIANSGWDTLNDDGTTKPDAKPTPVHIMKLRFD